MGERSNNLGDNATPKEWWIFPMVASPEFHMGRYRADDPTLADIALYHIGKTHHALVRSILKAYLIEPIFK